MASFLRVARSSSVPAIAVLMSQQYRISYCDAEKSTLSVNTDSKDSGTAPTAVSSSFVPQGSSTTHVALKPALEGTQSPINESPLVIETSEEVTKKKQMLGVPSAGMHPDEKGDYFGLFPKRQLWQPKINYPLWDDNWDGRKPASTGNKEADRENTRKLRKTGVTRHIILIRHGQYDETHKEDDKRVLTELGKKQAEETGKRLAEMVKGVSDEFGPCKVKVVRVSDLVRAKQTAEIIASHIPSVTLAEPDPLLNEGRPAHHIPGGKASPSVIKKLDDQHPRIEEAFQKLFYRAPAPIEKQVDDGGGLADGLDDVTETDDDSEDPQPRHEFEVIVCHANVIRYFLCRALQLPPETWLRWCTFNCSLTYLTIRPTGTVSCRMLGDIGHLPYEMSTFSMHTGYNW